MRRKFQAVSAGVLAAFLSTGVSAHVIDIYYDAFGGLKDGQHHTVGSGAPVYSGSVDPRAGSGISSTLSWGTPTGSGQSSVSTVDVANDTVKTNSGILVPFGSLVHNNNIITAYSVDGFEVSWNLWLYKNYADAVANNSNTATQWSGEFQIDFLETSNDGSCENATGTGGTVIGTGYHGTQHISDGNPQSSCDDVFSYVPIAGMSDTFTLDGEVYEIVLSGFYTGADVLTQSFWNGEELQNTGIVKFELREVEVPTPTTLALFGFGLFGFQRVREASDQWPESDHC